MKKHLFLIPTILLIGAITPAFSLADQTPTFTDIADAGVETKIVEKKPETTKQAHAQTAQVAYTAPVKTQTVTNAPAKQTAPATQAPAPQSAPVAPAPVQDSITIAGNTISITTVADTAVDSGNHVNRFKKGNFDGRFLYGHNSAAVFGGLKNLGVGATFTVTLDGVTHTYRIAKTVIFNKNVAKGTIELEGDETNYMTPVAKAKFGGVQYDLSIMTCHGQSLGGGDATQRFVIFANRIN